MRRNFLCLRPCRQSCNKRKERKLKQSGSKFDTRKNRLWKLAQRQTAGAARHGALEGQEEFINAQETEQLSH